jgi:alanyl-tRNA synthetase
VQQKGSLVNAERTRFDFAHNAPVTDAQIAQVEALVNAEILANAATPGACAAASTKRRSSAR